MEKKICDKAIFEVDFINENIFINIYLILIFYNNKLLYILFFSFFDFHFCEIALFLAKIYF
jgi:hypothetical protein